MSLVGPAFRYWKDGNTAVSVNVPMNHTAAANAKPYVVRVASEGWIPLNVIVFAGTREHARERVIAAITEVMKNSHVNDESNKFGPVFIEALKGKPNNNLLVAYVDEYDVSDISKIAWACNDNVLS